ncbi:polysaccharide biosynthesis tyrosine autokinase [Glutamicibacter nicotianae]|uniref:polysaccharide biosynthesis tyrosine autokinase n=1 Tax=Glutamicibacter nicotianae TaxID=37929 RepID=UPI002556EB24|nr:polysaccharide biosynthesis tyrosine autokinase [Glutamicibacter nicotianae]WIV45298.1 polysaccharide biosynthesis tyrosine autokinase [Glutamicibacter nicotianae]
MELRDYLRILHKYWILITACTLCGVIVGAGVSIFTTPKFEASTQLYVSVRGEGQGIVDLAQGSTVARQSVATYAAIATTESVLEPVIDKLNLDLDSRTLALQVQASAPASQSLINLKVTGTDAEQTADIANAVGESLKDVVEKDLEASTVEGDPSLVSLNTVQPAFASNSPISPRIPLNIALGALLGLALGIGIAVLRFVLDTRIHSLHDVEQVTDAPMLGGITYDSDATKRPLIVHTDPRSPRAESFRTLRTNLQFLAVSDSDQKRAHTFVISSAGAGEGKSTTSANLALALSETGSRVLLIDADLRMPAIAKYMGIEGGVGLTDILIGKVEVADVLQRWGRDELYVLPSGKIPPNPSELLGSRAMDELLEVAGEYFDYVIIDSPPILLVTDAAVVGKRTNGVLLVAASASTRKQSLSGAVNSLQAAGGSLRGVVMTMLPTKGPDSYAYGAYGAYGAYTGDQLPDREQFTAVEPLNFRARRAER